MLKLYNVRMKPLNVRKKVREPPNVRKELSHVTKIEQMLVLLNIIIEP